MWISKIATIASCCALGGLAAAQSTWYVDDRAQPPGNGTPSQPFPTIGAALANPSLADGDTVLVAPGTYAESVVVNQSVLVRSSGGALVTALRPTNAASGAPTLRVSGINSTNPEVAGFSVYPRPGFDANDTAVVCDGPFGVLRQCIVFGGGVGIGIDAEGNAQVQGCAVTGFGIGVGQFLGAPAVEVRDTISSGNTTTDLYGVRAFYTCFGSENVALLSNCVQAAPEWFDVAAHDLHLAPTSPCIDAGDPSSALDPDGSRADVGPLALIASYVPPTTYCTAKTNSLGCVPSVGSSGDPSTASSLPFLVTCENELSQKLGLMFYGLAPNGTPYQGGWLCVQAPVKRMPVANAGGSSGPTDCSGVYLYDFNARIRSGADAALAPGVEVCAQFWSRDSGATFGTNRSNALCFTIFP